MTVDMEAVRNYVRLVRKKRELDEQIEGLGILIRDAEAALVGVFKEDGLQSLNVDGEVAYLRRDVRASSDGRMAEMIEALRTDGQEWLVAETVNANTLASWVREFQPKGKKLSPEEIKQTMIDQGLPNAAAAIKISEQWRIGVKKA